MENPPVTATPRTFVLRDACDEDAEPEPETPGVDEVPDYSEDSADSWEEESSSEDEEADPRSTSRHAAFLLTIISPALDVVAIWRYPYIAYKHGGVVLVPCLILYFLVALPVVQLELTLGQLYGSSSRGNVALGMLVPMLKGFCYSSCALLTVMSIYHITIISWCLFYFFTSMQDSLPWAECMNNTTKRCRYLREPIIIAPCTFNQSGCDQKQMDDWFNQTLPTKSSSEYYFHQIMLHASDGLSALGPLSWKLTLCLLCAWFFVFLDVRKGKISFRKRSILPTVAITIVLCIMMAKATVEEGFQNGVKHYFDYNWSKLTDLRMWMDAGTQVVLSLGVGTGVLQSLGRRSHLTRSLRHDAIVLVLVNVVSDFFAGLVAFACLGFMAAKLQMPKVDFLQKELGTSFVIFSSSLAEFPGAIVWALLFFAVLVLVSLRRQQALVYGIATALLEAIPSARAKKHRYIFVFALCLVLMAGGFIFTFKIGIHLLMVIDLFVVGWPSFVIILVECIGVMFIYGRNKFVPEIQQLLQEEINKVWVIAWTFVAPAISGILLLFGIIFDSRVEHDGVDYTTQARLIGWTVAMLILSFGPFYIAYRFIVESGKRRFKRKGELSKVGERLASLTASGPLVPETTKPHWHVLSQRRKGSITPAPKILVVKTDCETSQPTSIAFGFVLTPDKQSKASKTATGKLLTPQANELVVTSTSGGGGPTTTVKVPSPRPSPRLRIDIPGRSHIVPASPRIPPQSSGTLLTVPQLGDIPMRSRSSSDASDVRRGALNKNNPRMQASTQNLFTNGKHSDAK